VSYAPNAQCGAPDSAPPYVVARASGSARKFFDRLGLSADGGENEPANGFARAGPAIPGLPSKPEETARAHDSGRACGGKRAGAVASIRGHRQAGAQAGSRSQFAARHRGFTTTAECYRREATSSLPTQNASLPYHARLFCLGPFYTREEPNRSGTTANPLLSEPEHLEKLQKLPTVLEP
jgi:hypothetical protein